MKIDVQKTMRMQTLQAPRVLHAQRLLVAAVGAMALSMGGCLDSSGTVTILSALDLNSGQSPDCSPSNKSTRGRGLLDIGTARSYTAALAIVSGIPQTASAQNLQRDVQSSPNYQNYGSAEGNRVTVESAEVYLTNENGDDLGGAGIASSGQRRPVGASGSLQNIAFSVGNANDAIPVFVSSITSAEATALGALPAAAEAGIANDPNKRLTVVAVSKIFTRTSGGGFDNTQEFRFPIDLCVGCLADIGKQEVIDGKVICRGTTPNAPIELKEDPGYNSCVPPGQDIVFTKCVSTAVAAVTP